MNFFDGEVLKDYPDILDAKQVREILKIGNHLVYKLLRENKIANLRIGKKTIVKPNQVSKLITHGERSN